MENQRFFEELVKEGEEILEQFPKEKISSWVGDVMNSNNNNKKRANSKKQRV